MEQRIKTQKVQSITQDLKAQLELILVAFLSIWHKADDSDSDSDDIDDSKNDEDNDNEEEEVEETSADDDGNSDADNDIDDYGNCVSVAALVSLTSHHGLKEEIVCFGLQFQEYKSSSRQGSMVKSGRQGNQSSKVNIHNLHHKHKAERELEAR